MWKGRLQLALVSCDVKLYSALSAAEQVHFHILNRKTGNRIRLVPHDAESGKEVPRDSLVKGFEAEKGSYVVVDPEEIEKLRPAPNKVVEIDSVVDAAEFDPAYADRPYYIAPDGKAAEETYRVIRDALAERGRVGLGHVVLQSRERSVALLPREEGLVLTTLLTAAQVRSDRGFFEEIGTGKLDPEMIDLAALIIQKKAGPLDLGEFRDRYQERLRELVAAKAAGRKLDIAKPAPPSNVIDLKAALRRAVAEQEGGKEAGREKAPRAAAGDKPARKPRAKRAARG